MPPPNKSPRRRDGWIDWPELALAFYKPTVASLAGGVIGVVFAGGVLPLGWTLNSLLVVGAAFLIGAFIALVAYLAWTLGLGRLLTWFG